MLTSLRRLKYQDGSSFRYSQSLSSTNKSLWLSFYQRLWLPKEYYSEQPRRAPMAFKRMLAVAAIIATVLRTIAVPTEYVVGDEKGWDTQVNYTAWSEGKEFRVGDTLVFKYTPGDHNVIKVGKMEFEACNVSTTAPALTSGFDAIPFTTAGEIWYLCGKENHCLLGQKLAVIVLPNITVEPPAFSSSNRITTCKYQLLIVVVAAMIML